PKGPEPPPRPSSTPCTRWNAPYCDHVPRTAREYLSPSSPCPGPPLRDRPSFTHTAVSVAHASSASVPPSWPGCSPVVATRWRTCAEVATPDARGTFVVRDVTSLARW